MGMCIHKMKPLTKHFVYIAKDDDDKRGRDVDWDKHLLGMKCWKN